MIEDWHKYENEVYEECCRIYGEENIERNITRVGLYSHAARQLDVLVHTDEGDIVYDAKYYSRRVSIKTVESMIGMYADLGVSMFVVVTNVGYSKAALRRAHMGTENVQAEVLSMAELMEYQAHRAFPFAGKYGVYLSSPFGWIIDGDVCGHEGYGTTLYRRGVSLNKAIVSEYEFAYVRFWDKDDKICTLPQLMEHHKEECLEGDKDGEWRVIEETPYVIAQFNHPMAVVTEYLGYKEFDGFILFVVMLCESEKWRRNKFKLQYVLEHALPFNIRFQNQE